MALAFQKLFLVVEFLEQPAHAGFELLDGHAEWLEVHVKQRAPVPVALPQQATLAVKAEDLASDISFALVTTCVGLTISIPLMFILTAINVRMRKMEELVTTGMNRFFDIYQRGVTINPKK